MTLGRDIERLSVHVDNYLFEATRAATSGHFVRDSKSGSAPSSVNLLSPGSAAASAFWSDSDRLER